MANVTGRAAVVERAGAPFEVTAVAFGDPGPGQVRVRLVASGLCHSDLALQEAGAPFPVPAIFGHEGAGVVDAVGAGVDSVAPGDHVLLSFSFCGTCGPCRSGHPAYCTTWFPLNLLGASRGAESGEVFRDGDVVNSHFMGQSVVRRLLDRRRRECREGADGCRPGDARPARLRRDHGRRVDVERARPRAGRRRRGLRRRGSRHPGGVGGRATRGGEGHRDRPGRRAARPGPRVRRIPRDRRLDRGCGRAAGRADRRRRGDQVVRHDGESGRRLAGSGVDGDRRHRRDRRGRAARGDDAGRDERACSTARCSAVSFSATRGRMR